MRHKGSKKTDSIQKAIRGKDEKLKVEICFTAYRFKKKMQFLRE